MKPPDFVEWTAAKQKRWMKNTEMEAAEHWEALARAEADTTGGSGLEEGAGEEEDPGMARAQAAFIGGAQAAYDAKVVQAEDPQDHLAKAKVETGKKAKPRGPCSFCRRRNRRVSDVYAAGAAGQGLALAGKAEGEGNGGAAAAEGEEEEEDVEAGHE